MPPLPCTCTGYDPADPCRHGDTSAGCPRHDPQAGADYLEELGELEPEAGIVPVGDLEELEELEELPGPVCAWCGEPDPTTRPRKAGRRLSPPLCDGCDVDGVLAELMADA